MIQPLFRSAAAQREVVGRFYADVFSGSPNAYLLLTPDLDIVNANEAYLKATMTERAALVGRAMFEAFPDNPEECEASGVRNLALSFARVLASKRRDMMALQRYDIRRPDGSWELRYWRPSNWSVLDDRGSVIGIVHHVRRALRPAAKTPCNGNDGDSSKDRRTADLIAAARLACELTRERIDRTQRSIERSTDQIVRSSRRKNRQGRRPPS